jgi:zona occludens toxin (predicted ATPase)
MTVSIYTGVPGTGKTAHMVDLLEEQVAKGRIIFSNISGLKLPHYRLGAVQTWQQGTWLHIDKYVRTSPLLKSQIEVEDDDIIDDDTEANWLPNPDVFMTDSGVLMVRVRDHNRQIVGAVQYQNHKGALIVIDECQNFFRPRPAGSPVPDHVAAFEVHRKQDLDFWLVTQRLGLLDSNVRGLCGRHVALRSTFLGRFKYEWPEVGDIESKASRDTAARTRYKLPKHVFTLYKSAESHTKQTFSMPFMAKAMFFILPLVALLAFKSYSLIEGKFHPAPIGSAYSATLPNSVTASGINPPASERGPAAPPQVVGASSAAAVSPGVDPDTLISACLATATHCQCYTHDGVHVPLSMAACHEAAEAPTHQFRLKIAQQ